MQLWTQSSSCAWASTRSANIFPVRDSWHIVRCQRSTLPVVAERRRESGERDLPAGIDLGAESVIDVAFAGVRYRSTGSHPEVDLARRTEEAHTMGDRVQQAASQLNMQAGETVSITFADDKAHDGHSDAYLVTKTDSGSFKVTKEH